MIFMNKIKWGKIKISEIREYVNPKSKKPEDILYYKKDKTSTDNIRIKNEKKLLIYDLSNPYSNINNQSSEIKNQSNSSSLTNDNSKNNINIFLIDSNNDVGNILDDIPTHEFNPAKVAFCLKLNLYDILLNTETFNKKCSTKYRINDKYFAFVYPNDYTTYSITISGAFSNRKNITDNFINNEINEKTTIFYSSVGLFFCGKNVVVNIGKEKVEKKCQPDSYMCKNCIETNKKKYKIKNNYLINIHGRIVKINKGCYHCFGNFLCGNQIIECITKFQCKACRLLQENI